MNMPVLNSAERRKVVKGLEKQGATLRKATSNDHVDTYEVYATGGTCTIDLSSGFKPDVNAARKHVEALGLHWPLAPKPRALPPKAPTSSFPISPPIPNVRVEIVTSHVKPPESRNSMPDYIVEKIGPSLAEDYLGTMKGNRKLSSINVTKLARQMRDGLWVYDGSPIRFNTRGELVDGQHRLWALIESDFTTEFLVVRGVEIAAMATMDTGKSRSFVDILTLEFPGIINAAHTAAAVQMIYRWEDGRRGSALQSTSGASGTVVPNAVLLEFYTDNRARIDEVVNQSRNNHRVRGLSGAAAALAFWIFDAIDSADTEFFFARLKDGVGLEEGSAILALRNYLHRALVGAGNRTTLPADLAVALMIKAWNAYRQGDPMKVMSYRRGGSNPEQFPTPR